MTDYRRRGQSTPSLVGGIIEGLFAPLLEAVVAVIINALISATPASVGQFPWGSFLAILFIIDLIRNVAIGLSHSSFALGNIAGNIFGLWLFYSAITDISPEAAGHSVLFTGALVVSFIVGVILSFSGRNGLDI